MYHSPPLICVPLDDEQKRRGMKTTYTIVDPHKRESRALFGISHFSKAIHLELEGMPPEGTVVWAVYYDQPTKQELEEGISVIALVYSSEEHLVAQCRRHGDFWTRVCSIPRGPESLRWKDEAIKVLLSVGVFGEGDHTICLCKVTLP